MVLTLAKLFLRIKCKWFSTIFRKESDFCALLFVSSTTKPYPKGPNAQMQQSFQDLNSIENRGKNKGSPASAENASNTFGTVWSASVLFKLFGQKFWTKTFKASSVGYDAPQNIASKTKKGYYSIYSVIWHFFVFLNNLQELNYTSDLHICSSFGKVSSQS